MKCPNCTTKMVPEYDALSRYMRCPVCWTYRELGEPGAPGIWFALSPWVPPDELPTGLPFRHTGRVTRKPGCQ